MIYRLKTVKSYFFLAVALLLSGMALGAQDIGFRGNPGQNINADYSLDGSIEITRTATITHRGTGTDFFFTLDAGQNSGGNPLQRSAAHEVSESLIRYQAMDTSGNILTNSHGIFGSFPDHPGGGPATAEITYVIRLLAGQFPEEGRYTDTIELQLYIGGSADNDPVARHDMSISISMNEVIDMRILDSGAPHSGGTTDYELSYSQLLPGTQRSADLAVLANVGFSVTLESGHAGELRNQDSGDSVPYRFLFDGTAIDLTAGGQVTAVSGQAPTSIEGRRYIMEVEILPYESLPAAGIYQDAIGITIQGM